MKSMAKVELDAIGSTVGAAINSEVGDQIVHAVIPKGVATSQFVSQVRFPSEQS